MSVRSFFQQLAKRAPGFSGAVCCAAFAFGIASCDRKSTPDWDTPGGSTPVAAAGVAAPVPSDAAKPAPEVAPATEPAATPPSAITAAPAASPSKEGFKFIGYNLANWLTMDRYVDNKPLKNSPKPDSEKKAVVRILATNAPDVLGVCEIGEAKDLAELQESLKAAGLDLPHSHYAGGSDPVRHLGLLSRFPITSTSKPGELEYQMNGQTFGFNRGVLDATIQARGRTWRFLGVHLKSKRDVEEGDQEEMRIHEAHLLRKHVDSIFQSDPQARLVVYGDFNDTYPSKSLKAVTGSSEEANRLTPIYLKDSRYEAWTHHWKNQDIYSRIDFIMLSSALKSEVNFRACHIIEDPEWDKASDHRPVMAAFK